MTDTLAWALYFLEDHAMTNDAKKAVNADSPLLDLANKSLIESAKIIEEQKARIEWITKELDHARLIIASLSVQLRRLPKETAELLQKIERFGVLEQQLQDFKKLALKCFPDLDDSINDYGDERS